MTEFERRKRELEEKAFAQDLREFKEFKEFRKVTQEERRKAARERWAAGRVEDNPPGEPTQAVNVKKPSKIPLIILLIVSIICIIGCGVSVFKAVQYQQENAKLEKRLIDTTTRKDRYLNERDICIEHLEVYYGDFAYITEAGKKFHKFGCPHIRNSSLYVNYITELKRQGYKKCHTCYSNDFKVWE